MNANNSLKIEYSEYYANKLKDLKKFIYVASPYSTGADMELMTVRADMTALGMGQLILKYPHYFFYSPVCHFRPIALQQNLPHTKDFWWKMNKFMLDRSDEMKILNIPGWNESEGIQQETDYCNEIEIKVTLIDWVTGNFIKDINII